MKIVVNISPLSGVTRKVEVKDISFNFEKPSPIINMQTEVQHFIEGKEITSLRYPVVIKATDSIGINKNTMTRVVEKVVNPNAVNIGQDPDLDNYPSAVLYGNTYYNVPEGEPLLVWPENVYK